MSLGASLSVVKRRAKRRQETRLATSRDTQRRRATLDNKEENLKDGISEIIYRFTSKIEKPDHTLQKDCNYEKRKEKEENQIRYFEILNRQAYFRLKHK